MIEQGATLELTIGVKNKDGTPKDLTGFSTRKMQIRTQAGAVDPPLAEYDAEITIPAPTNGQVVLEVSKTETAGYVFRQGVYDLFVSNGTKTYRLIKGNVSVSPMVTTP
jgi:hypothetical protein